MKHANVVLACLTCAAMLALAGCGESKPITEVKALPFNYSNLTTGPDMTVDQALDNRKVCDSVKWSTSQDDHKRTVVEYDCNYKGIDDSMFVKNGMDAVSAGDVWQWTYGADGTPSLTGVGLVVRHKDGTATTTNYGAIAVSILSSTIIDNKFTTFDQAYAYLMNKRIPTPRVKESTKSVSAIPDTTYGNKLAPFFPDQPPQDAAIHAYLQKGMPESVGTYGIDSLGYLTLKDTPEARAALYPVDPADVQLALKVSPYAARESGIGPPFTLQDNKLVCLNEVCYDKNGHVVGKAPSEVMAKETEGASIDQFGVVTLTNQTQQAAQPPSQQVMQQVAQQDTAAQASSANPLPTGSSDEDWPAMTPCIKKLDDAYVNAAHAQNTDETVSIDQMKEWASTCKAEGE